MRSNHDLLLPDVLRIRNSEEALAGIALYVGDGATLTRPIVRYLGGVPIGHTSIATQLQWCARAHVPRAIFTHCGTAVVRGARQSNCAFSTSARRMVWMPGSPATACERLCRKVDVRLSKIVS
jgi:hypothetical protein